MSCDFITRMLRRILPARTTLCRSSSRRVARPTAVDARVTTRPRPAVMQSLAATITLARAAVLRSLQLCLCRPRLCVLMLPFTRILLPRATSWLSAARRALPAILAVLLNSPSLPVSFSTAASFPRCTQRCRLLSSHPERGLAKRSRRTLLSAFAASQPRPCTSC